MPLREAMVFDQDFNSGDNVAKEKHPAQALLEKACKEQKINAIYCDSKEEWLDNRKFYLTGTDMSALLGLNPWKTAGEVIMDKRNRSRTVTPPKESEPMEWGLRLEKVILQAYEEKNLDVKVYQPKPWTLFAQAGTHEDDLVEEETGTGWDNEGPEFMVLTPKEQAILSFIAGTPDGFAYAPGRGLYGLEVKTTATAEGWKTPPTDTPGEIVFASADDIPIHYYIQVQTYMTVMPFIECFDVVVLIGGNRFRVYHIKRDESMIDTIKNYGYQIYCQFLQATKVRTEIPSAMLEKNPAACVKAWPHSMLGHGLSLESSDRAAIAAEAYFYVNKYVTFLESLKSNLRGIIVARMKMAETLTCNDVKVSYKSGGHTQIKIDYETQFTKALDYLRATNPAAYASLKDWLAVAQSSFVTATPPTRRFLVTVPKDKQKTISAEVINGQLQKLGESHMGHAVPSIGVDETEV